MWKDCSEVHQTTYPSSPEITERDCEIGTEALRGEVVDQVGDEDLLILRAGPQQRLFQLPNACGVATKHEVVPGSELVEHKTGYGI